MLFKRIKYRIGFILFATLVFSLGGVLGHTYWTLKQRFLDYSTQSLKEIIQPLEEDIIYAFQDEGSLDVYRSNPNLWAQSTRNLLSTPHNPPPGRKPPPGAPPRRGGPEGFSPPDRLGPPPHNFGHASGDNTPNNSWQDALRENQRAFTSSLSLYDAQLNKIAGQDFPLQDLIQHAVTLRGNIIAIIAYKEPHFFVRSSEFLFLDQQLKSFALIGIIGLTLAFLIASLVSKSISIPLSSLAKTAKRIATGDFSARIKTIADDEIGDICKNFNAMAEKLEAHELSRKRWVADISHEMRTPLAVLKAQVEAIEDGVRPANKENLMLLSLKINSINHLINDLYELSLFDIGAMRCNKEPIDIRKLVEDFIHCHYDQLVEDKLMIEFSSTMETAPEISADRERITQLLNNIFQNSKRYTDRPGKILWTLQADVTSITLTFEDSSPSIELDKIDKIFERLYRTDESRNRERGGAGLGLSICKSIVEIHEGTISARQSSLGGIAVIVKLPII